MQYIKQAQLSGRVLANYYYYYYYYPGDLFPRPLIIFLFYSLVLVLHGNCDESDNFKLLNTVQILDYTWFALQCSTMNQTLLFMENSNLESGTLKYADTRRIEIQNDENGVQLVTGVLHSTINGLSAIFLVRGNATVDQSFWCRQGHQLININYTGGSVISEPKKQGFNNTYVYVLFEGVNVSPGLTTTCLIGVTTSSSIISHTWTRGSYTAQFHSESNSMDKTKYPCHGSSSTLCFVALPLRITEDELHTMVCFSYTDSTLLVTLETPNENITYYPLNLPTVSSVEHTNASSTIGEVNNNTSNITTTHASGMDLYYIIQSLLFYCYCFTIFLGSVASPNKIAIIVSVSGVLIWLYFQVSKSL